MSEGEPTYTYNAETGKWTYSYGGEEWVHDNVAILFQSSPDYDTLHKHGNAERIKELFNSEMYSVTLPKLMGEPIFMVQVAPEHCQLLNDCIQISASKYCTKLLEATKQKERSERE